MNYFFTGDWHLWHRRIIELSGRPYPNIDAHNDALQVNINKMLKPSDHLVILGDVAFGPVARLSHWLDCLVTKNLHLVWGNHDGTAEKLVKQQPRRFQRVGDVLQFKLPPFVSPKKEAVHIFCSHYAHRVWNKSHHGSYHVYGHSHGSLPDDPKARSMDVGVDTNNYKPWALEDIIAKLDQREWRPVDHHTGLHQHNMQTVCARCGIIKYYHQSDTLNCPRTVEQPGHGQFHPNQFFSPKLAPQP